MKNRTSPTKSIKIKKQKTTTLRAREKNMLLCTAALGNQRLMGLKIIRKVYIPEG